MADFLAEASKFEPKIRRAMIDLWNQLRTQHSTAEIERAFAIGGIESVMNMYDNISSATLAALNPIIDEAIVAGAGISIAMIPNAAITTSSPSVSLYNSRTVSYLENYKFNLINTVSSNTIEAIRSSLISDSIAGENPRNTARNFRNTIGLTPRQEQAVRNYNRYLRDGDSAALQRGLRDRRSDSIVRRAIDGEIRLTEQQIERLTNRYRERYIKYRAETIARTESLRAISIGNRSAVQQLLDSGDIDTNVVRRFWRYTHDSRTRHAHREIPSLNQKGVRLDEPYRTPLGPLLYPRDPNGSAANTVQCRCTEFYRIVNEQGN